MGKGKIDPRVKDVLGLLGIGVLLLASVVAPGLPIGIKAIMEAYEEKGKEKDFKEWEKFNLGRLRQALRRLQKQKVVEIVEENGETVVKLTKKGKLKALRYKFEEMRLKKPSKWDGWWQLVIYDIPTKKCRAQELFRHMLKNLKFLRLQKSVYLTPFPCEEEIEFLREYFGIGEYVIILKVKTLEEEGAYRKYFGI